MSRGQRAQAMQPDPAVLPDAPQPRLSPVRVLLAVVLLLALSGAGYLAVRDVAEDRTAQADAASREATWFAPYVDATLTPTIAFQDRSANPAPSVVLGFVVAGTQSDTACTPTWGSYETLEGAATNLDLDRRVAQVRGQGGEAVVSFGGQANRELAVACDRPDDLVTAYRSVIDRYDTVMIDFDIEGSALADTAANVRRAKAVAVLQSEARADGDRLSVWLTLPVTAEGLNADALSVVRTMLAEKVDVAGVNVMAMNFGGPSAERDLRGAITSSLTATHRQLGALFGPDQSASYLWGKLGVTVMIGQNDVDGERLSVADAKAIAGFASSHGLARVSAWSLNRDAQCGATFAVIGTHSNLCSGVAQKPLGFTKAFARLGAIPHTTSTTSASPDALPVATGTTKDDPARSPYPIWQPERGYHEGYKVVWHQAVYIAQWYSEGETPDAQNLTPGNAPWRLIGPVLSTDRAPVIPKLPAGTYPEWYSSKVFEAGTRVLHNGLPYQASWYTQSDVPGESGANGTLSPWKALYRIPGEPVDG